MNFIKTAISLTIMIVLLYGVYVTYDKIYAHNNVYNINNNYVINNTYTENVGVKYTDVKIKPLGYIEPEIINTIPNTIINPTEQIIVNPTLSPTKIITPTNKPSINVPSERVTLIKNKDLSILRTGYVAQNPIKMAINDNDKCRLGSEYYYHGDLMVLSGEFINVGDKLIKNPEMRIFKDGLFTGYSTILKVDIEPYEKELSFIEMSISDKIPPGYYNLEARFYQDNELLLTVTKQVNIFEA